MAIGMSPLMAAVTFSRPSVITMLLRNLIGGFWSAIDGALASLDPTTSALRRRPAPPSCVRPTTPNPSITRGRYSYRYT